MANKLFISLKYNLTVILLFLATVNSYHFMNKLFLALALTGISAVTCAQSRNTLSKKADSLYKAKNYSAAGPYYVKAANAAEYKPLKKNDFYNAACSYALAGKSDSAFLLLHAALDNGYTNLKHIKEDTDFNTLHALAQWQNVINTRMPVIDTDNPYQAKLVTTDVQNFWKAYDLAQKDTANRYAIYKKYYLDLASRGMQDYFAYKVSSLASFVKGHDRRPKFYAGIRKNTYKVETQKKQMQQSFVNFKKLYPAARFPDMYFIIGAFSSGGTASDNGLLVGLDQSAGSPDVPVEELSLWERNNLANIDALPYLMAHELIHYQQKGMGNDTTLLKGVLVEGMADFIGELISGKTANPRLHTWAKGREKQIWTDFKKDMYLNKANHWIANSDEETAEKPADLGYWVGYYICKAYYQNSADKKKAIDEMLHIKDYRQFYTLSKAPELPFLK
jgi:hypothetical protein